MSKLLNQMNSIWDMGKFPWSVHLGASLNIVFTIWLTNVVFAFFAGDLFYLIPFGVLMVTLNVMPVVLLRYVDRSERPFPEIPEMNFFSDQHRFSTWVYAIASANMFFWIVFSWCSFTVFTTAVALYPVAAFGFLVTYVPLWRTLYGHCCRVRKEGDTSA